MANEFANLYSSLFDAADKHIGVVRALADKPSGLSRKEIAAAIAQNSGGSLTVLLDELIESGFIQSYLPYKKTLRDTIFKLSDEYSRFYLKFIEHTRSSGAGTWARLAASQSWKS